MVATINVGVFGQVVIEAGGVRSRVRDPGHPVDEVVQGSRPLETVGQDPDSGSSDFLGMRGLNMSNEFIKTKNIFGSFYLLGYLIFSTVWF